MLCPKCGSSALVKNSSIANGKKKFLYKECSRQFAENSQNRQISDAECRIVDMLIIENIHSWNRKNSFYIKNMASGIY
jgi:transposase-like protein